MVTEQALVDNAISGMMISFAVAFVVLLLSTMNFLISIYASVVIMNIVISVLAMVYLLGWALGVIESIASIIVIGFSVDYVVHLSNAYLENEKTKRYERTQEALSIMGASILGGALTT
jgi:predicted RND superfamily exporter protein